MLGEAFTILAVLEATDKMSGVLEKVDAALDGFSETASKAAESAMSAGARIDEALLQTASGADAVELADARLAAAQDRLTVAQNGQADAERAVLDAQAQAAAAADGDTAASERLIAASDDLTAAQQRTAAAAKSVSDAQRLQADTSRAAAASTTASAAETDVAAEAQTKLGTAAEDSAGKSGLMSKAMGVGALAVAAIGYESIKAAGNWQSLTEHLVTDAGESQKNLAMVSAGMLQLAATTGTSTTDIANGMYHVESAGYHGAEALSVMKAAAEGAKVGGADLDTVSKALTGTMNAYSMSGSQATSMMDQLVAAVGQGDMKMQDLASSLGNVAPVAAAAHISFAQIAGAIATMTAQNMSAQQATQDLAHTIGSLQNPNAVAVKEMQALGLNVNQVSKNIGKVGLTGTLEQLTKAVASNTKGGDVLISTFQASKQAAANAQTEIAALPASLQSLAKAYLSGSVTSKQWTTDLQAMPPVQAALMKQFASTANQTQKFNQLLTSGSPAAQTYNAAMSKLLGGATGLKTALMLTGGRAATFQANVKAVGDAASQTGKDVTNWGAIQQTFNQKMDVAKASIEAAGVSIGQVLLPVVSSIASVIAKVVGPMATWMAQHQKWVGLALAVAGAISAVVVAIKAWEAVQGAINALMAVFDAEADANPIGLIVMAIAALIAGLIYAYTHFKTFRDIVNDVGKVVMAVWKGVSSFFVGLWKTITGVFSSAIDTVVNVVKHWYPLILAVLSGGILLIPALIFKYWNQISGFFEGIWNDVVSVTTTIWDGITGFFKKWWPLLLAIFATPIAILLALWNHTHQAIFTAAKAVWNAISSFFVGAWHAIESAAETAWGLIKRWIVTPMEQAWAELNSIFNTVMGFLSGVWNSILGAVKSAWGMIKQYIIQPIVDVWNYLTGFVNKFNQIGQDIINGIISGLEAGWNWLSSSISNIAQDALNVAKSVLGINSPSRAFADEVGKWIPHGIAQGIQDNVGVVHSALAKLGTSMTTQAHATLTTSLTGAGSGLSALGAGAGGGAVAVTIDLRGAVVSNQAGINQLADKVGVALAKRLPQAGIKTRAI